MKKAMRPYKTDEIKIKKNIFKENGLYSSNGIYSTIYSNFTQAKNKAQKLRALGYDCEAIQDFRSMRFVIALKK